MKHVLVFAFAALVSATTSITALAADDGAIAGPASAQLTIEEYVDFDCPFCVSGNETVQKVLVNYPGKVKVISRPIALASHGESAVTAVKAYNAVYLQNPTLAASFQNELFKRQQEFREKGDSLLYSIGKKIGADVDRMKADMKSPVVTQMLADNQAAFDKHGFSGTPSFMIGKETMVGAYPYAQFKEIVDRQLH